MESIHIRDLIYFDFNKAASIWSQFEGGLRERVSLAEDKTKDRTAGIRLGIPHMVEASFGTEYGNVTSVLESKILHHDLLNKIMKQLVEHRLVVKLSEELDPGVSSPEVIRAAIADKPYILAGGWGVIEDYKRISSFAGNFNDLFEFISRSSLETIKKSAEYADVQRQIDEMHQQIKTIKDVNQKSRAKTQLQLLESKIKQMMTVQLSPVEDWLVAGIQLFVNTFVPNRINFRIYPFESCPSFQVICNLKRECFVDQDLEHLLYGYGNRPNVPLAVFGLITSLPSESGYPFDPMKEFESMKLSEKVSFEKAFRNVFQAMDDLEGWMRYSRYPNVTIHPIAVSRQFQGSKE
jgi:hypothetical protein